MQEKQYVTPGFAENFLKLYENKSEDVLYQALINSLIHSEDLNEPLKGIKENTEWFKKVVQEQLIKGRDLFCDKFCENRSDIESALDKLKTELDKFAFLSNILGAILETNEIFTIPSSEIRQDTIALSMLIILCQKVSTNLVGYCKCEETQRHIK